MDDLLTPLERTVKTYLVDAVTADLVELLAHMALARPSEPRLWLAQQLLERAAGDRFIIVEAAAAAAGRVPAVQIDGGSLRQTPTG